MSRSRVGLPYTRTEMTELTYAIRHASESSYSTMISSTRSVPVLDTLQLITTQFSEMASSEMYSPSSNRKCIARRSLFVSSEQSSESFLEGFTRIIRLRLCRNADKCRCEKKSIKPKLSTELLLSYNLVTQRTQLRRCSSP